MTPVHYFNLKLAIAYDPGPGRVMLNYYREFDPDFGPVVKAKLKQAGIEFVEVPVSPDLSHRGIPPATGVCTSLLVFTWTVIFPIYGIPADDQALQKIEAEFPGSAVFPVNCATIARHGGSLQFVMAEKRIVSITSSSFTRKQALV